MSSSSARTANPTSSKKKSATGRDANGRFLPGNAGGPGNPFARQIALLRSAFCKVITPENMEELAHTLYVRALQGDLVALKLILQYTLGKPAAAVDPDTLDAHEFEVTMNHFTENESLKDMVEMMPKDLACDYAQMLVPHVNKRRDQSFNQNVLAAVEHAIAKEEAEARAEQDEKTQEDPEVQTDDGSLQPDAQVTSPQQGSTRDATRSSDRPSKSPKKPKNHRHQTGANGQSCPHENQRLAG